MYVEADEKLSRLLALLEEGEDVVIGRGGRPVARLVPVEVPEGRRIPGRWRGRVRIADDFDGLPDEVAAAFLDGDP